MNIIDIVIVVCLTVSTLWGFKDGAIRQAGTLGAVVVALILAKNFGPEVATLLKIGGEHSHIWGYVIVLIVTLIAVGTVATLLRKIFKAVGLSALDRLAGAVFGFLKCALLLSLLLSLLSIVNISYSIIDRPTVEGSKLYSPIVSTSSYILPAINWAEDQLPKDE